MSIKKSGSKEFAYPEGFMVEAFDDMRNKLLDTASGRSRLLNLDQNGRSFVRVVDEQPNQLADTLIRDKVMTIIPVPEPTSDLLEEHDYIKWNDENKKYLKLKPDPDAKEWAKVLGLKNDYELPQNSAHANDNRHSDADIQTLLYEPALNKNLTKLTSEARSAIEETGNNILFLCLGFLEWRDKQVNGKVRLAPLYLLPVEIFKDTIKGVKYFKLKYSGEDVIPNLTLREKLKNDFEISLPSMLDNKDETTLLTPEQYFKDVEALIARKSNDPNVKQWRVRHFGTLATLSLGKLLMYLDLDPKNWPGDGRGLLNHEVIRSFFSNEVKDASGMHCGDDYVLDDVEKVHELFPMVEDADSSQMSALIDILKGKSLVVEGPPGTGKSQTITNLLAAAMAQGKSVLFIAEKQAALDVVKKRLDNIGLGDFCLDLHSEKAQKRLVLDSFQTRIVKQPSFQFSRAEYERQVARYERAREELQSYALLVNSTWKNTGLTIHEILTSATKYANRVAPLNYEDVAPSALDDESFSIVVLDEEVSCLDRFFKFVTILKQQLDDRNHWSSHPWYGFGDKSETGDSRGELTRLLESVNDSLQSAVSDFQSVCDLMEVKHEKASLELTTIEGYCHLWSELPAWRDHTEVVAFSTIEERHLGKLKHYIQRHEDTAKEFSWATTVFFPDILNDLELVQDIHKSLDGLQSLGIHNSASFDEIVTAIKQLESAVGALTAIKEEFSLFGSHFDENASKLINLSGAGLNELVRFFELVFLLPPALIEHRSALFDDEKIPDILGRFRGDFDTLVKKEKALEQVFILDSSPAVSRLDEIASLLAGSNILSVFSGSWRSAKKECLSFCQNKNVKPGEIASSLRDLAHWKRALEKFNNDRFYREALGSHFKGLDTQLDNLIQLADWYRAVRLEYGVGFGRRVCLAELLFSLPLQVIRGFAQLNGKPLINHLKTFASSRVELSTIFPSVICLRDDTFDFTGENDALTQLLSQVRERLSGCQRFLLNPSLPQHDLIQSVARLTELRKFTVKLEGFRASEQLFSGRLDLNVCRDGGLPLGFKGLVDTVGFMSDVHALSDESTVRYVLSRPSKEDYEHALRQTQLLISKYMAYSKSEQALLEKMQSEKVEWYHYSGLVIEKMIARNAKAINEFPWLSGWVKYLHAKDRLEKSGFEKIKQYFLKEDSTLEYAGNVMKFAVYRCLAQKIYKGVQRLSEHSGHEQTALQKQFSEIDEKLKSLQRLRVAAIAAEREIPAGQRGAKVSDYTENFLLTREIEKKTRHISIRNLVRRAGRTMQQYKPCFMMSPMAVAKYLPPSALSFDFVVMDEASQVKPEYALSCFARAKNIVVVGDPKQLPPTSFFESSLTNDDVSDDDKDVLNESESILEAISNHFPKRQLRWHYRSRHESLIAFSNTKFYDSSLVVFPSPWNNSDEYGIKFNYVENACFVNSINVRESREVAEAVRYHLINHAQESIGVVAMNVKQRDQIESDIEALASQDAVFRKALNDNQELQDPLFVKNLENVQGDEREVIFISFTYGPKEKGSSQIPQRFGPINGKSGWRRLNVLFTRAKKRIQVYASFTSDHVVIAESSQRGVVALKEYLAFAKSGRFTETSGVQEREPDSPFEISVIEALEKEGFEAVPQVGVAGFFIDIAVKDPGMPGRYLMGIECDGASYHSNRTTRDRDKVRQSVLEGLGWNIKRIWSTDWFAHSEAELKPIIEDLRELASPLVDGDKAVFTPVDESELQHLDHEQIDSSTGLKRKTLEQKLQIFNQGVILQRFINTPDSKRLLRDDMIEYLVKHRPMDASDFAVFVPNYIRAYTDADEARLYLADVLEIIAEHEEV